MSEKLSTLKNDTSSEAKTALENARLAHQKYIIKQQPEDIDRAILYYVDAIKYNPQLSEAYYRLASLMWEKGQISLLGAIEQCKTAISLDPENINAHIYAGYFLALSDEYKEAEKEFKYVIKENRTNTARPRLFLSQLVLLMDTAMHIFLLKAILRLKQKKNIRLPLMIWVRNTNTIFTYMRLHQEKFLWDMKMEVLSLIKN